MTQSRCASGFSRSRSTLLDTVSFYTHVGGLDVTQGYGYAGYNIVLALQRMGIKTPYNDINSPVQLNFTQPYYYQLKRPEQYVIGYTPWESTKLWDRWAEYMNECDEVWTANDFCAKVFVDEGVTKPIYVYEHGIEPVWTPYRRRSKKTLKFLHVGEPAPRKNGQMVYDAFHDLFGNNDRYSLTIKANGFSTIRYNRDARFETPDQITKNVNIITETVPLESLISLYHQHDVLVYPSWGEGFGFIPIQALATGMPTIMNTTWASYRRHVLTPHVKDTLVPSPWPDVHPGNMLEPNYESLKESMLEVANNFEEYSDKAYKNAPLVHAEYTWDRVTRKAFKRLSEKF